MLGSLFEGDTILHSWGALAQIIDHPECKSIVLDTGMPARQKQVKYNRRVIVHNRKILLIRPKRALANEDTLNGWWDYECDEVTHELI